MYQILQQNGISGIRDQFKTIFKSLHHLSLTQKISVYVLFFLLISIPATVISTLGFKLLNPHAQEPITPPSTPPESVTPTPSATFMRIVKPNGGEIFYSGENRIISWESSTDVKYVDLQYSSENGFNSMIIRSTDNTGYFSWQVNTLYPTEKRYRIFIYGYNADHNMITNDTSDDYFYILKPGEATPSISPTPSPRPTPTPVLLPDLAIVEPFVTKPNPAELSDDVLISFKITNIGNAFASSAQFTYTSQADGYGSVDPSNTCVNYTTLNPGQSCVSAYTFKFKTPGVKLMQIALDKNNLVNESNENNNYYYVNVNILAPTPTVPPTPTPTTRPTPTPTLIPTPSIVNSPTSTIAPTSTPTIAPPTPTPVPPQQCVFNRAGKCTCKIKIFGRCII